jgi:hypothetical protein
MERMAALPSVVEFAFRREGDEVHVTERISLVARERSQQHGADERRRHGRSRHT